MLPITRLPMFGFATLAFLLLCAILAFAVWFATRGAADPAKTRVSGPAGCAIGCALLVVTGLGALATAAVVAVNLPAEWARRGPLRRFELTYADPAPDAPLRAPGRVRAEIELAPGFEAAPILSALRREIDAPLAIDISTVERESSRRTLIRIEGELDEAARADFARTLRDLREDLGGLGLPDGIVIEVREPDE